MLSETERETLRLAEAHGGKLRAPGIGPLWRICSRLCELGLLERWGIELTLTDAGRARLASDRGVDRGVAGVEDPGSKRRARPADPSGSSSPPGM